MILKYCFYPYVFYFTLAQIYYLYFTEQDVTNFDIENIKNEECGVVFFFKYDCKVWKTIEIVLRWIILLLVLW